jgi:hypothetical protein
MNDKEITLIDTGMGRAMMLRVLEREVKLTPPDLLISMGFAGSLCEDFAVGDVLLGGTFFCFPESGDGFPVKSELLRFEPSPDLTSFCTNRGVKRAQIVTVTRPEPKGPLSRRLREAPSLMDMESYHAARYATEAGIPFLCFRAVSDGLHDEIDFDLNSLTDESGRVRIPAVLAAMALRPRLVRSFYGSWLRSSKAAAHLGEVLAALLRIDGRELRGLGAYASFTVDSSFGKGCP